MGAFVYKRFILNRGLSLIEVLIGLIILAVAVLPLFAVFSSGFTGVKEGSYHLTALHYAEELMNYILAQPYQEVELTRLKIDGVIYPTGEFDKEVEAPYLPKVKVHVKYIIEKVANLKFHFKREYTDTSMSPPKQKLVDDEWNATNYLKKITLTVSYQDVQKNNKKIELVSYKADIKQYVK